MNKTTQPFAAAFSRGTQACALNVVSTPYPSSLFPLPFPPPSRFIFIYFFMVRSTCVDSQKRLTEWGGCESAKEGDEKEGVREREREKGVWRKGERSRLKLGIIEKEMVKKIESTGEEEKKAHRKKWGIMGETEEGGNEIDIMTYVCECVCV